MIEFMDVKAIWQAPLIKPLGVCWRCRKPRKLATYSGYMVCRPCGEKMVWDDGYAEAESMARQATHDRYYGAGAYAD